MDPREDRGREGRRGRSRRGRRRHLRRRRGRRALLLHAPGCRDGRRYRRLPVREAAELRVPGPRHRNRGRGRRRRDHDEPARPAAQRHYRYSGGQRGRPGRAVHDGVPHHAFRGGPRLRADEPACGREHRRQDAGRPVRHHRRRRASGGLRQRRLPPESRWRPRHPGGGGVLRQLVRRRGDLRRVRSEYQRQVRRRRPQSGRRGPEEPVAHRRLHHRGRPRQPRQPIQRQRHSHRCGLLSVRRGLQRRTLRRTAPDVRPVRRPGGSREDPAHEPHGPRVGRHGHQGRRRHLQLRHRLQRRAGRG